jgi:hypothetical protein
MTSTRRILVVLGFAAVVLAGCSKSGGDDAATTSKAEATTTAAEATTTEATTTTADEEVTTTEGGGTGGDVPTYDDAKRVYLAQADEATKSSCADDAVDKDLNVPSGSYTKLICGGIVRFEYIQGAENDAEQWPAISAEEVYRSVFHIPGELIVAPVGSNDEFAPALADDCGCGDVVEQQG